MILVAGAATRDEAASDTPLPDARTCQKLALCRKAGTQMHLSLLPILVEWPLQMLGPTAAASSTASAPAGPSILRLEICSVRTIESQEYTYDDECFTLEFDM